MALEMKTLPKTWCGLRKRMNEMQIGETIELTDLNEAKTARATGQSLTANNWGVKYWKVKQSKERSTVTLFAGEPPNKGASRR